MRAERWGLCCEEWSGAGKLRVCGQLRLVSKDCFGLAEALYHDASREEERPARARLKIGVS